jgi:PAS domain S-box-containing protein
MLESFEQICEEAFNKENFSLEKSKFPSFKIQNKELTFRLISDWSFQTKAPYRFSIYLIEGRVLLVEVSGKLNAQSLKRAETLIEQATNNADSKVDSVIFNFSKVSSIAILARKELKEAAFNIGQKWENFYIIVNKKLKPLFEAIAIQNSFFEKIKRLDNLEDTLLSIFISSFENDSKINPTKEEKSETSSFKELSRENLERFAKNTLMENARLKAVQQTQLYRLYQIIHHISWDGGEFQEKGADKYIAKAASKAPQTVNPEDLQSAVQLLKSDIQEKLVELKRLNQSLAEIAEESDVKREENEANLLSLIENTSDFIYSLDDDLNYIVANNAYKDFMKRYKKVHVRQGRSVLEGLDDEEKKFWKQYYMAALNGKVSKAIKEVVYNNNLLFYEASFHPIFIHEDDITGVTVFLKDITQEKLAEQRLKEQNEELKRVNNELDQFVYRTSHDLRSPLTSILGLVNIARMDDEHQFKNSYLDMIEKSIQKLDKFIGDIIDYSRNSRLEIQIEKINFLIEINEIIESLQFLDKENLIKKEIQVNANVPFYGDKLRLHIILNNLIANAFKYHRFGSPNLFVKIYVEITENYAKIMIEDNGRGIPNEYLDRIFDMFFRASEKETGSGLGLYIVKESIRKLNGTIHVTSTLGEGTKFVLKLPNTYQFSPSLNI